MPDSPDRPYPEFLSFSELKRIGEWADLLGLKRATLVRARYEEPGLPYFRIGHDMYIAESQLVWWLNQRQRRVPDAYWMDRRRRLDVGTIFHDKDGNFARKNKSAHVVKSKRSSLLD